MTNGKQTMRSPVLHIASEPIAMANQTEASTWTQTNRRIVERSTLYQQGIVAGTLGAATIALWFLVLDTIAGRPLYTPTVLGMALFRGGAGLDAPGTLPVSGDMVVAFTWVHVLIFVVVGGMASHLLAAAERMPNLGFGVVILFVVFEFGFIAVTMIFAEPALHALAWPAILVGNTLAATVMCTYLWRRHPNLKIEPKRTAPVPQPVPCSDVPSTRDPERESAFTDMR